MPNPFFSARIPPDLLEKIEKHIAETGESKTQILIKALAAYVKHPIEIQAAGASGGVSLEMFSALEDRVAGLEQLLQKSELSVISDDKTDAGSQPIDIIADNNLDNNSDPWLDVPEPLPKTPESSLPSITNFLNLQSDAPKVLPAMKIQQEAQNHLDNTDNTENTQPPHPTYNFLTSPELRKLTGMAQFQVDSHKRKVNEKHKKLRKPLEEKRLLESPEKITTKNPITVDNYSYDLFYAGQNKKGKDVWNLVLADNVNYQTLSLQVLEANQ